jgi:hypothetical protein
MEVNDLLNKALNSNNGKYYITKDVLSDIENLIKRNKELEQENKILKNKQTKIIADSFHEKMAKKFDDDFIPKSKVKEKIEEYKHKIEKLENKKIWNEPVDTINKNRWTNYINSYLELLEES